MVTKIDKITHTIYILVNIAKDARRTHLPSLKPIVEALKKENASRWIDSMNKNRLDETEKIFRLKEHTANLNAKS